MGENDDLRVTRSLENAMISDPNIPETGGQAARALHNSDDEECCFHVCSDDASGSGICVNCTEPWKHGRVYDPPTAPHCEINTPQVGFTGRCTEVSWDILLNSNKFIS